MAYIINNTSSDVSGSSLSGVVPSSAGIINAASVHGQLQAIRRCSAVQSAIMIRVNAFANFRIFAQDKMEKRVMNDAVFSDLEKLEKINDFQDFRQFTAQLNTYLFSFGKAYIWKVIKSVGFDDYDLYVLPSHLITPVYKSRGVDSIFRRELERIDVNIGGETLPIDASEITLIEDNYFNFGGYSYGESRLTALSEQISTLLSINETTTELISDGGARGIISQGANSQEMFVAPFVEMEKEAVQEELKKYGNLRGQFRYIVMKGAANYTPITAKLTDMDLSARGLDATTSIYNRYGIPSIFVAKEPRFQAMPEGRKELYTSAAIPEAIPVYKKIIELKGIPKREWSYLPDVSHMDFFQEGLRKGAIAVQQVINGVLPAVEKGVYTIDEAKKIIEPYI